MGILKKRCHSEYNVKLRFSRHWSNVNACCDVGEVTKNSRIADTGSFFPNLAVRKVILKSFNLYR